MSTDEALSRAHTPPHRRGPVSLVLALVVLFGVVLAAVWLFAAPTPRTKTTTPKASGAVSVPDASSASGCNLRAGDQTVPTDTPPGVTWSLIDGLAVPSSPTAGPAKTVGPVPSCFAHNPVGAVIATIRIYTAVISTHPGDWLQVVQADFAPGPATDAGLAASMAHPGPNGALWIGPRDSQIAGFHVLAYSTDVAVVSVLWRTTATGGLWSTSITVRWVSGDWKLEPDSTGRSGGPTTVVPSMLGWIPFGGV
jgi:hypothetical protein